MSFLLNLYRVRDTILNIYEYVYSLTAPSLLCLEHSNLIDSNLTTILNSVNLRSSIILSSLDSPYTVTSDTPRIIYCNTSSGSIILNLPTVLNRYTFHIVKTSASNTVSITPFGLETIDSTSSKTLTLNGAYITFTGILSNLDWSLDHQLEEDKIRTPDEDSNIIAADHLQG